MTVNLRKIFPVFLVSLLLSTPLYAADQIQIRDDAPDRYEVVKGDTLWDISGRFLEDPWLWPEVWALNPQIENPNLIYPGDIIELQYNADGPILTLRRAGSVGDAEGLRTVKLSPQVRVQPLDNAIPAIPLDRISAVLSQNVVLSQNDVDNAPYLLGNRNKRLLSGTNDIVYARGNLDPGVREYNVVRPGAEYTDPDSGDLIGIEGKMIGTAAVMERNGDTATLRLTDLNEEARAGDRFIPSSGSRIDSNYFPRPPAFNIEGRILDIVSGRKIGSLYDSIIINKGSAAGLKSGDLLALQKPDVELEDDYAEATSGQRFRRALGTETSHIVSFDGEIYASVLLYRVFDNASLGIVISASEIIRPEDKVVTP